MGLQKEVKFQLGAGVIGEASDGAVITARAYTVYGAEGAEDKAYIGRLYSFEELTVDAATGLKATVARMGGEGKLCGILINPKEHFVHGFNTQTWIDGGTAATIAVRGHFWVPCYTSVTAGDDVYFTADGKLGGSTLASGTKLNGARWLRTSAMESGDAFQVAEIALDEPTIEANA